MKRDTSKYETLPQCCFNNDAGPILKKNIEATFCISWALFIVHGYHAGQQIFAIGQRRKLLEIVDRSYEIGICTVFYRVLARGRADRHAAGRQ